MRALRTALFVAMAAALSWAPSTVLGAPPNQLADATVSPGTGDTATLFRLTVRYVSSKGSPATSVRAQVGPTTVALDLVSGTPVDGTWSASTTLPVGAWQVTYAATASGPSPTLSGPMVLVQVAPTPSPQPTGARASVAPQLTAASQPPSLEPAETGTVVASPSSTPEGQHVASGAPHGSEASATTDVAPVGSVASAPAAPAIPTTGADAPSRQEAPVALASPDGTLPADPVSPAATSTPAAGALVPDDLEGTRALIVLLAVLVAGAAVALLATGWLLAVRERREDSTASWTAIAASSRRAAEAAARRADRHRSMARSRDPILAAMGLDDDEDDEAGRTKRRRPRGESTRRPPAPRG